MPFAGSVAPEGYLLCDGSAVSRSEYSDLFTSIGTTYGSGDGSSTFNIPNLSGRVVIGVSQSHALGSTGGEATHVLTSTELPAHVHEVPQHGHGNDIVATTPELSHTVTQATFTYNNPNWHQAQYRSALYTWVYGSVGATNASRSQNVAVANHAAADCTMSGSIEAADAMSTNNVGLSDAHNNMQPYSVMNYIISTGA